MVWRRWGFLAPLLILLTPVLWQLTPLRMLGRPAMLLGQAITPFVTGALIAGLGVRRLLQHQRELGRPLRPHEWIFDFADRSPFDSFAFIQMPIWSLAHFAIGVWALQRAL